MKQRSASTPESGVSLEAVELSCGYGAHSVLRRLNLTGRPGEVLALLGPNGSGKTTLLRCFTRLLRAQGGSARLLGQDVWSYGPRRLARQVALAGQVEQRQWPLTVFDAVLLGRTPHRGPLLPFGQQDRAQAEQAIRRLGLEALAERPITELSGGEWRRVVLARTLAQEPKAMLLDEPTAQLDLKHQITILQHVRQLAIADRLTIVLTLHDLNQAALYADRLALLADGHILVSGDAREVLSPSWIEKAYGVRVQIISHPTRDAPLILPVVDAE